jgi:ATP-dependent Lon protease
VTSMPGKGNLKLTGSLGDIMKESAEAAFSFIKSHHAELKIDSKVFEKNDFHIHIPDGATPKDGPSAGITIATALVSHLTNRPAKSRTAMTGEITLRGKITPVGGIKEKVIAALVSGIRTIVMPDKNEKDLENIPDEVRKNVKFIFVSDIMESLHHTLGIGKKPEIKPVMVKNKQKK